MPVSCRDLWFRIAQTCDCGPDLSEDGFEDCPHDTTGGWTMLMYRGRIRDNGRLVVTDRIVALYTSELTGCEDMPAPQQMTQDQTFHVIRPLLAPVLDASPTRLFNAHYLDVLEPAGYRVVRLHGQANVHGLVNADRAVVGLLMPVMTGACPATLWYPVRGAAA